MKSIKKTSKLNNQQQLATVVNINVDSVYITVNTIMTKTTTIHNKTQQFSLPSLRGGSATKQSSPDVSKPDAWLDCFVPRNDGSENSQQKTTTFSNNWQQLSRRIAGISNNYHDNLQKSTLSG